MGLGGFPDVSLAAAREQRDRWAAERAQGRDPLRLRDAERRARTAGGRTLAEVTALAFEARRGQLRDDGKAGRWLSPLNVHVLPTLGGVPVDELTQADLERALRQIWRAKPVTARKALNRVGIVLAHGAAMGLDVDLNAKAKALALLGDTGHAEANIPAMPWAEVPAFYASLSDGSAAHLALRLLILTAARSRPCGSPMRTGSTAPSGRSRPRARADA